VNANAKANAKKLPRPNTCQTANVDRRGQRTRESESASQLLNPDGESTKYMVAKCPPNILSVKSRDQQLLEQSSRSPPPGSDAGLTHLAGSLLSKNSHADLKLPPRLA